MLDEAKKCVSQVERSVVENLRDLERLYEDVDDMYAASIVAKAAVNFYNDDKKLSSDWEDTVFSIGEIRNRLADLKRRFSWLYDKVLNFEDNYCGEKEKMEDLEDD